MKLIQIFLPLYNSLKENFPENFYRDLSEELTDKYGGITAYNRSPATGFWKENEQKTVKDDIIIYEVMSGELERQWWKKFKEKLEKKFEQDEIIIRAMAIDLL